jgi:hypothetical protein
MTACAIRAHLSAPELLLRTPAMASIFLLCLVKNVRVTWNYGFGGIKANPSATNIPKSCKRLS